MALPQASDNKKKKKKSATWETWALSLAWKNPLEKSTATYSGTLAWRIPMDRED